MPVGIHVLDDLHEHDRVEAVDARILVGRGRLQQPDPLAHPVARLAEVEPAGRGLEVGRGDVGADDRRERGIGHQVPQQRAGSASDVRDRAGPELREHGVDRLGAHTGERGGARRGEVRGGSGLRGRIGSRVEPLVRLAHEVALVREVAAGDEVARRVLGEPAVAGAHQLADLVVGHPVVLPVVEHGQQHVEVAERVGEADLAGGHEVDVAGVAPVGERGIQRHGRRLHPPGEGPEQLAHEVGAAARGQGGDRDAERQGARRQLGEGLAAAAHRRAEDVPERDREHRRRRVRPVVHVVRDARRARAPEARGADERDRIHLEQQRHRAPLVGRLRVDDVRGADGEVEGLRLGRVLAEQVAEVRRRVRGLCEDDEHGGLPGGRMRPGAEAETHRSDRAIPAGMRDTAPSPGVPSRAVAVVD